MRVSNNYANNMAFKSLFIDTSAYDKAAKLNQCYATSDDFQDAKEGLLFASKDKLIGISAYGDGAVIHELDDMGQNVRMIAKDGDDFIGAMTKATKILNKENESPMPNTISRVRFPGTGKLNVVI